MQHVHHLAAWHLLDVMLIVLIASLWQCLGTLASAAVAPNLVQLVGREAAQKLESYASLLLNWNKQINLVSREIQTEDDLMENHIIPCLSIPLAADFQPGSTVLDVGTGGGLPGLVSAICAPDVRFTLVDTQRKKIMAVAKMATLLGVKNVLPFHQQVEHIAQQYDFVTGRAVIRLPTFLPMVTKNLRGGIARSETDGLDGSRLGSRLGPGILYLKGGDFDEEVQELGFSPLRSRLDRWIPNFDGTQELLYLKRGRFFQQVLFVLRMEAGSSI